MMMPYVYKFEVTIEDHMIEKYNKWKANLLRTPEHSAINWVHRPFDQPVMLRSYYDQESNAIVVYIGNEVINKKIDEYLILSEPVVRNGGRLAEMTITSSDRIIILSVLKEIVYDGMNSHLKLLNKMLGTDFETSDDNPVF